MDIKVQIKEEPSFLDFCSENDRVPCSNTLNRVKSETVTSSSDYDRDTSRECEQEIMVSKFCSQNEREEFTDHSETKLNKCSKVSEIETKKEIEEQLWWERTSKETLYIYDTKDGTDQDIHSIKSPRLHHADVPSYTSDLFSSEELESDVSFNMGEDIPKFESQETDITDVSSLVTTVYSETYDGGEIVGVASCLTQNDLLQQGNTTVLDTNNENCKSTLSCGYRKLYKCDFCEKSFAQLQHLKRHKLIHEGVKPYKCDICDKMFTRLEHMKTHKLIHEAIKPQECNICGKTFTRADNLKAHKLIHESIKPHKCNICDRTFTQLQHLKIHKLIHEGIKPNKCDICDKAFTRSQHLKRHKLIHEGLKLNKCDVCNKAFTQFQHLKRHKWIHEDKKPKKCDICNKEFTHLQHLKKHKLIHEGIKPDRCDICDRVFTRLSSLKRHKMIHEGIQPYKCDICNKAFTRSQHLKRHKLIHGDQKTQ